MPETSNVPANRPDRFELTMAAALIAVLIAVVVLIVAYVADGAPI